MSINFICRRTPPMMNPSCDRHKNVQMVPFTLEYPGGEISGHVCPVAGCGRHHVAEGYFDVAAETPLGRNLTTKIGPSVGEEIRKALRVMTGT
jgi:hypothetical protein